MSNSSLPPPNKSSLSHNRNGSGSTNSSISTVPVIVEEFFNNKNPSPSSTVINNNPERGFHLFPLTYINSGNITCLAHFNNNIYIGTSQSSIIKYEIHCNPAQSTYINGEKIHSVTNIDSNR